MGRSGKRRQPAAGRHARPGEPGSQAGGERPGPTGRGASSRTKEAWREAKRSVIRFVLVFGVLICAFNAYFSVSFSQSRLFESYLHLNAECSASIIRLCGDEVTVNGTSIISPRFSLSIRQGCDAIQASAFFVLGVLVFPMPVSRLTRLVPAALGALLLLTVNLIRIVSLYYAGIYSRNVFDVLHAEIWQAGFIFLPILLWLLWLRYALSKQRPLKLGVPQ